MALKEMQKICDQIRAKWTNIKHIAIYHRKGNFIYTMVERNSGFHKIIKKKRKYELKALITKSAKIELDIPLKNISRIFTVRLSTYIF